MKKLVLKELREQFKVALIGLAVFSMMLFLAFSASSSALSRVDIARRTASASRCAFGVGSTPPCTRTKRASFSASRSLEIA